MDRRRFARCASATLLAGASLASLATAARAQTVVFSSAGQIARGPAETGREYALSGGTVQIRLAGGAMVSFVESAQFSLRPDGSIDLRKGSVTVVGAGGGTTVHLPAGVAGTVAGGGSATFTALPDGARGSTTAGSVSVLGNGVTRSFAAGQFWRAAAGQAPDRVIAGLAAAVPGADAGPVQPMREGGVVAAAENGVPIALGEALAGVGARGDIVAAARRVEAYDANPSIAAFPTGDYALLAGYAARAAAPLGPDSVAFRGAGADIIRTYFEYLAAGNAGGNFRAAYAQVLLNYLDLLRAGVLPSTFKGATQAQLNAYLAFIGRTEGFGALSAANRQLLDAYLAFLSTGGAPDAFGTSVTGLTGAFLNYVRGGGDPAKFTQASASVVAQYLAIVNSGGLKTNLTAQNQALLAAYIANNGIGFTTSYATGLAAFVAYLDKGGLPSAYAALPAATVRSYLETLETTGLFDSVLGGQAAFLRGYLAFLRTGGTPDQFNQLPINVARVNASSLSLYVDYLLAGGAPTAYTTLTQAQVRAALDQLTATGQFDALLGQNAAFLSEYYAYIRTGADPDAFAGLPSVDVNAYAASLQSFAAFLRAGNLPSGYAALTAQQVRSYLTALQVSGKLALLGSDAGLLGDYLAYLRTGGAPDAFAGLPIVTYQGYASALAAYYAFLAGGGVPSAYTALSQAQVREYLDMLKAVGQADALLGQNAAFFSAYLAYLQTGGAPDAYAGLPSSTYGQYAAALSAYYAYLNAGGLPSGYTALTAAQIRQYLDVLKANGQLAVLLGANAGFFSDYLAFLAGGGSADAFTGLPIVTYQNYASALAAYYTYLAGGGLPAGYTKLTQAQVRAYLDALNAAGQLTALLGQNATFFADYYAYLAGGGAPDAYAGLPAVTYANYANAVQAFVAYLRGNGLPSGYAALSAAQLREYLAVLAANGQLARIGGAADVELVDAYAAWLAQGGAPNQFQGLPAFVTYEAALRAYYAYLTGGGKPSAYTALTQAQILAYIQALDAAGLVAAKLTAEQAKFLRDYAVYVAAGSNPDQFAGLPTTPTPTAPVVAQGLADAPRGTGTVAMAYAGKGAATPSGAANGNVVLTGNNVTAFSGAGGVTTQSAQTVEARTVDKTVGIARLSNGTYNTTTTVTANANEGMHVVWGTPATTVPTTGTVSYGLVSATAPTVEGGAVAPGTFAGNLGVDLATRRIGWDSVITIGGVSYRYASQGGIAAPGTPMTQQYNFNGAASTANNGLAGSAQGFLAGAGGTLAGFAYSATAPIGTVTGAAVFGSGQPIATLPDVTWTGQPQVTPSLPAPTYSYASGMATSGVYVRSVNPTGTTTVSTGMDFRTGVAPVLASGGGLQRTNAGTGVQDITVGTAKTADVWGDARVLIGRWYDGTYTRGSATTNTLSASQSLHYVMLAPASFAMPTSGQVNYALLAATQPTYATGVTGAGLFDGKMALAFGSAVKVALEGTIRMPEPSGTVTYAFSTPGGVAGVAALTGQTFSNNVIAVTAPITGTGLACTTGCQINFTGGFGGADVNRIGAIYYTTDTRGNAGPQIQGAAIFTGTPVDTSSVIVPMPARPAYSYAGGFSGSVHAFLVGDSDAESRMFNTSGGSVNLSSSVSATTVDSFGGGAIGTYARLQSTQADMAGDGTVLIGRWTNGAVTVGNVSRTLGANDSIHYALLKVGTLTMPTIGTIQYKLIGATAPTMYGGGAATAGGQVAPGLFDAKLGITFGSAPKVGIEGAIYMPETTAGATKYSFTTSGGAAAPGFAITNIGRFQGGVIDMDANITGSGLACPSGATTCQVRFTGEMGGADASRVGVTYLTVNSVNSNVISGAAAFAAEAPAGGGGGGDSTFTGTATGQTTYAYASSSLVDAGSGSVAYQSGKIQSYQSMLTAKTVTAGVVQESGRLSDAIGWARWTGDSAGPLTNQNPNTGVHVMSGTPTAMASLPASGTAQYTLVGGTKPTMGTLSTLGGNQRAPGTITGSLAIAYGATPRVGFDLSTNVGEFGWRVATTGGAANPGASQATVNGQGVFSAQFNTNIGTVTPLSEASCRNGCNVTVGGQLYGAGGSHIGLAVNVLDTSSAGLAMVSGIAVFAKTP